MRLIDADVIIKALDDALDEARKEGADLIDVWKMGLFKNFIKQIISHTPSIDAEPIRHGRWIKGLGEIYASKSDGILYRRTYHCSQCGQEIAGIETDEKPSKYCPACGAKMDEEEKEDEDNTRQQHIY